MEQYEGEREKARERGTERAAVTTSLRAVFDLVAILNVMKLIMMLVVFFCKADHQLHTIGHTVNERTNKQR